MNVGYYESKRRWWSRLSADKNNGLLNHQTPPIDSLVVCRHISNPEDISGKPLHIFSIFSPLYTFGNELLKTNSDERTFFEVILGERPQKPYFDIDIGDSSIKESEGLDLINNLKKSILYDDRIKESDILVFSSHGTDKLSYHVIINNWCLPDYNSNKTYCGKIINRIPDSYHMKKFLDDTMYKSIQQLRTFGSTKVGKERFKILDKHPLKENDSNYRFDFINILSKSLITNTGSCRILEYSIPMKSVWTGSNEDLSLDEIKIIEMLPLIVNGTFEILDIKCRLIPLKRKNPSMCPICLRIHENENAYLTFSNDSNKIYYHCHRKPGDKIEIWINTNIAKELIPESVIETSVKGKSFMQKFLGKK